MGNEGRDRVRGEAWVNRNGIKRKNQEKKGWRERYRRW